MSNPDRVYSREQLLDYVWGRGVFVEERTVDVHIRRLRKALNERGYDRFIQTVTGSRIPFLNQGLKLTDPWKNELQRIAGLVLVGLLLGALSGNLAAGLLLTLLAYLGWHLYNMYRLVALVAREQTIPATRGQRYLGRGFRADFPPAAA